MMEEGRQKRQPRKRALFEQVEEYVEGETTTTSEGSQRSEQLVALEELMSSESASGERGEVSKLSTR